MQAADERIVESGGRDNWELSMPHKIKPRKTQTSALTPRPSDQKPNRIVLDDENPARLFARELRAVELTGHVHNARAGKNCNIIDSVLDHVLAESVEFVGCDWKDSAIRSSQFLNSTFGSASLAYNSFLTTNFEACTFDDTDIQNCDFDQVVFVDCDLRHLLVKTCTFSRCQFIRCKTNNKLFETCRFIDTVFRQTELQLQTVAESFGITASGYEGRLRGDRTDVSTRTLSAADLSHWLRVAEAHPLHKVNVEYFLKETLLPGSRYIDACAILDSWLPMFRTANSFVVVLNQWIEFLLWLYERDQVSTHTMLTVHNMTGQLLSALSIGPQHRTAVAGVSGAHLSMARVADNYLDLVEHSSQNCTTGVSLLVEGDGSKSYYKKALAPLFAHAEAQIVAVVPHNSPWDLIVSFGSARGAIFFMAFLLATRTHMELSKVRRRILAPPSGAEKKDALTRELVKSQSATDPILSLDLGLARPSNASPHLRLRAYLPGSLLAELKITVGSCQIGKLRKTIKDLL